MAIDPSKLINIGRTANDRSGDPLRTAFEKVNANFTELYNTDTSTKYHLGDDIQFVDVDPTSGAITIQSGYNTSMPVYIKGANCASGGVGGNVVIEAGAPPLANGGPLFDGTVGNVEIAAQQTTIDSNGSVWTFKDDGSLETPNGQTIISDSVNIGLQAQDSVGLIAGQVGWEFDLLGRISSPSLFPRTFTAVLDTAHMTYPDPAVALDPMGELWTMDVTFAIVDGHIETQVQQIFPILNNPGYVTGYTFGFTSDDHGIPGYGFSIELGDVVNPGPAGWTSNIAVSQAPALPPSITSDQTLLLNGHNSVVVSTGIGIHEEQFRFDGRKLYIPQSGDIVDYLGNTVLGSSANTGSFAFADNLMYNLAGTFIDNSDLTHGATSALILPSNSSNPDPAQLNNFYGPVEINTGVANAKTWTFDTDGDTTMPLHGNTLLNYGHLYFGDYGTGTNMFVDSQTYDLQIYTNTSGLRGGNWVFKTNGDTILPGNINSANGIDLKIGTGVYNSSANSVSDGGTQLHIAKVVDAAIGNIVKPGWQISTSWGGHIAKVTVIAEGTGSFGDEWIFVIDRDISLGFVAGGQVTFGIPESTWTFGTDSSLALAGDLNFIHGAQIFEGGFGQAGRGWRTGLNIVGGDGLNPTNPVRIYPYGGDGKGLGAGTVIVDHDSVVIQSNNQGYGNPGTAWTFAHDGKLEFPDSSNFQFGKLQPGETGGVVGMTSYDGNSVFDVSDAYGPRVRTWSAGRTHEYNWFFGNDGTFTLPSSNNAFYTTNNALIKSISDIQISAGDDIGSNWIFGGDGHLTIPGTISVTSSSNGPVTYNRGTDYNASGNGAPTLLYMGPTQFFFNTNGFLNQTAFTDLSAAMLTTGEIITFVLGSGTYTATTSGQINSLNSINIPIFTNEVPISIILPPVIHSSSWNFNTSGKLTLPAGGDIVDSTGETVLGFASTTTSSVFVQGSNPGGITIAGDATGTFSAGQVIKFSSIAADEFVIDTVTYDGGYNLTSIALVGGLGGPVDGDEIFFEEHGVTEIYPGDGIALGIVQGDTGKVLTIAASVKPEQSFLIMTESFNAVSGYRYGIDTTLGTVTATLPATPNVGDAILLVDSHGMFSTNGLIIDPNGNTIMSASGNLTVNTNNENIGLFFNGSDWRYYA